MRLYQVSRTVTRSIEVALHLTLDNIEIVEVRVFWFGFHFGYQRFVFIAELENSLVYIFEIIMCVATSAQSYSD